MEQNEISRHQVAVFKVVAETGHWMSAAHVAGAAGVAGRTARHHLLRFVRLNIVDQAEVFPGHRYRLSPFAAKRNRGYIDRLHRAADAFNIKLPDVPDAKIIA